MSDTLLPFWWAADGHYYLSVDINGAPVNFVVDTGATDLVLTRKDAARVGLDPDSLIYQGRANTANVASGVTVPGLYPLPDRNFTILELFSLAGGPLATMNAPQVRLVRGGQTYGIPFDRLLAEPQLNITVIGGDRVFVVDDDRQFIALGATGSQSIFDFPQSDLSALEAVAFIGGVNGGTANPESVLIMREYPLSVVGDGVTGPPLQRVVFGIDLTSADGLFSAGNFPIQDNDLIYGTESALGALLTAIGLGNTVSSVVN